MKQRLAQQVQMQRLLSRNHSSFWNGTLFASRSVLERIIIPLNTSSASLGYCLQVRAYDVQVASFTSTTMAADVALAAALPIGSSQLESELLLQQTAEAQLAQLE